ncbi:MAG: hypothetical protein OCD03_13225 [Hyphomicrobiales bacterium]
MDDVADSGQVSDDASESMSLNEIVDAAFESEGTSEGEAQAEPTVDVPELQEGEQAPTEEPQPEQEQAEQSQLLASEHWDSEMTDAFATLNDTGKQAMLNMSKNLQAGFTRKSQETAEKVRSLDTIENSIPQGLKDTLQAQNMSTSEGVGNLIGLYEKSQQDPMGYMQWFAQQHGIDLGQMNQQPQEGSQQFDDPAMAQLQQQIDGLNNQIAGQQQTQQKAQHDQLNQTITDFKDTLDDGGNLKYPHYEQVKGMMGSILASQPEYQSMNDAEALETAYQSAVYADPKLRDAMQTQAVNTQVEQHQKHLNLKKAKKAAPVPSSAASTPAANMSLDDIVSAAMENS